MKKMKKRLSSLKSYKLMLTTSKSMSRPFKSFNTKSKLINLNSSYKKSWKKKMMMNSNKMKYLTNCENNSLSRGILVKISSISIKSDLKMLTLRNTCQFGADRMF
jgi:hypothetical protein